MCSTIAFIILRMLDDVQRGTCIVYCCEWRPAPACPRLQMRAGSGRPAGCLLSS